MSASELHKGRKLDICIQMSLHGTSYFHSLGSGDFIYQKDFILVSVADMHIVSESNDVPIQTMLVSWRKTCRENVCGFLIDVFGKI